MRISAISDFEPVNTLGDQDLFLVSIKEQGNYKSKHTTLKTILDAVYPVGSVYISVNGRHPDVGTWKRLATSRTLWNAESDSDLGGNLSGILPNHCHGYTKTATCRCENCFTNTNSTTYLDAKGDTTYSTSSLVADVTVGNGYRPPSIGVSMWKRTA